MALKVGDKIPEILGYDQTGKELKPPDVRRRPAVYEMHIQNCRKRGMK